MVTDTFTFQEVMAEVWYMILTVVKKNHEFGDVVICVLVSAQPARDKLNTTRL